MGFKGLGKHLRELPDLSHLTWFKCPDQMKLCNFYRGNERKFFRTALARATRARGASGCLPHLCVGTFALKGFIRLQGGYQEFSLGKAKFAILMLNYVSRTLGALILG